ncbi:unnamed protein product [Chondrus crispus]|uniref:Chromo domain-containing protein n=1 Tax=Chondrus crispus TaxID=2769 RepID=R7QIA9_CHOCR|nr:unnamed protein product [Chondrus crispus]CDF38257.1 unnamed protein product [Chondrus crispus]|eukprot:XP_005718142.1 unnamed protein product [Chondrus crispus]
MVLQPHEKLYTKSQVVASNGVVQVEPNREFRVLVANFGIAPYRLVKGQTIGTLLPHPTAVIVSKVSVAAMLDLTDEEANEVQQDFDKDANWAVENTSMTSNPDDVDISHVPARHRDQIKAMLLKYSSMWSGELGEIKVTKHHIDTMTGTRPIAQNPYRAGPHAREAEMKEVDCMLRAGVLEPSKSAWASPVALLPKKDGQLRFCVDYRRLNAVTIRDSYPLPRMDERQERVTRDRVVPAPVQPSHPVTSFTTNIHDQNRVHCLDRSGIRGGEVSTSPIEQSQVAPTGLADLLDTSPMNGAAKTGIWNRARIGQPRPSRRSDGTTKSRPKHSRHGACRYARLANDTPVGQEKNSTPPADSPRDEPTPASNEGEGDARHQLEPETGAQNVPAVTEQHSRDPRGAASNNTTRKVDRNQSLSPHAIDGEEYVVDHVVAHRYDDDGKLVFRVRLYGYTPEDDTEEPISHLRRNHVILYCKRKGLNVPDSIIRARQG